jgi:hypothetical protein
MFLQRANLPNLILASDIFIDYRPDITFSLATLWQNISTTTGVGDNVYVTFYSGDYSWSVSSDRVMIQLEANLFHSCATNESVLISNSLPNSEIELYGKGSLTFSGLTIIATLGKLYLISTLFGIHFFRTNATGMNVNCVKTNAILLF